MSLCSTFIKNSSQPTSKLPTVFATSTHNFTSCLDGEQDFYSLRKNVPDKYSGILLVYLHGLGGDFTELDKSGLSDAISKSFPGISLLSCNYGRTSSWGNAISRIDITNNIKEVLKSSKYIILVGSSMGGSAVLSYAATAPSSIKDKIVGIVSVAPCAELEDLYQQSTAPEIKKSLETALGGNPSDKASIYHQNSLDACLAYLPTAKIAVVTAATDAVVPIELQMAVIRDLNNRNFNIKSLELEGKSDPPPVESIIDGLHFILP